eukprot:TRINITY_DN5252_c0_g2_i1.p1 TRINITY_DN5252_c0_g2~~TRINITY_DN5252_c0_g2_i1.p1  ORF type:complete len:261 (-),score=55.72 TRINITY_DN5252_c0_g2_i1:91-873(-)
MDGVADGPAQWARIERPSLQELPKLQQELGIWMANTKYQMQDVDRFPLWRVQNTSMVLSTGCGISAHYALQKFRPGIKFPLSVIPPFVTFYLAHRAAQTSQMPGLWSSFLALPSPLGASARGILEALRRGKRLPSDEYGSTIPMPGQRTPQAPPKPASKVPQEAKTENSTTPQDGWGGIPAAPDMSSNSGFGVSIPQQVTPVEPKPVDPWAENSGPGSSMIPDSSFDSGWGGDAEAGKSAPQQPKRMSWDEIRQKHAAQK